MKEIYQFLCDLAANNNKEWFDLNRKRYEDTRAFFLHFTEALNNEIRTFDKEIAILSPKDCMFRIFRDVRFSNDKRPFKINYGSFIAKEGRKSGKPGYYFHIEPESCFIGGGVYMPPPEFLLSIRNEIFNHPHDFIEVIDDNEFQSNFKLYNEHTLKTTPKGFPKDFEHIDLLRYKSYSPFMELTTEQLFDPNILEFTIEKFKIMHPFNQFLYSAIEHV